MTPDQLLTERVLELIPLHSSVLDVGSGLATYHEALLAKVKEVAFLDAHSPYLNDRGSRFRTEVKSGKLLLLLGEAMPILETIDDKGVDIVLGIDFVEHLHLEDAFFVIGEMQRIATKRVILFIPEGNHPQEKDFFNSGGDKWQTHRSTWSASMVEDLGFAVEVWPTFHAGAEGKDAGALWCVWERK